MAESTICAAWSPSGRKNRVPLGRSLGVVQPSLQEGVFHDVDATVQIELSPSRWLCGPPPSSRSAPVDAAISLLL
jgi:hypothetical protein